jgi:hypothetical protein
MVDSSDDSISNVGDIKEKKKTEAEIMRHASFPELNTNPIVEMDLQCNVKYANPAAKALFPDIETSASCHPFFADWKQSIKTLHKAKLGFFNREVKIRDHWFYQQISLVREVDRIQIYAVGIDELKNAENALQESEQTLGNNIVQHWRRCYSHGFNW